MWKFSSLRRGKLGLSPAGWSNDETRSSREVFEPRSRGGTGILRDIVQVSEPVAWPLSSCSPFSTEPSRLSSLQTFPPFVPPYLLAFFFACMARGYTPFLSPSTLQDPLSHTRRRSLFLSLSLLSCSIPFKESGMKHASETAFYLKKKKTNRRRNWSSTIIQRKKKRNISLFWLYYFFLDDTSTCSNSYDSKVSKEAF